MLSGTEEGCWLREVGVGGCSRRDVGMMVGTDSLMPRK
jgi:hypothetical protein